MHAMLWHGYICYQHVSYTFFMIFWNGIREQRLNETVGLRLPQDYRDIHIFCNNTLLEFILTNTYNTVILF